MPIHNPFGRRGVGYNPRTFNPFSKPVTLNAPFYSPYQQRQLLPERYEEKIHGNAPEVIQEVIENAPPQEIQQAQQRAESEGRTVQEQIAIELVNEAKTKNSKWGKYSRKWEADISKGLIGNAIGAIASFFGEERPNDWLTEAGITADEYLAAQNVIDYAPTGITGTQRGDYSGATGGLFSSAGVATDPTTGFALEDASGSDVYSSWTDWGNVLAAGSASGWRGGFLTERQYSQLSPVGRENYQNFINTYNEQQGTNLTGGIPQVAPAPAPALIAPPTPVESGGADPFGTGQTYDSNVVQQQAAAQQAAYEEAAYGTPAPTPEPDTGNRQGSGYGGQAQSGEWVSSDHDWSAAPAPSDNDSGGGGGGGGGKIVCTAMNEDYGFGSYRQAIWLKYSESMTKEHEVGYHAIFRPLLAIRKKWYGKPIYAWMKHVARHRTADLRAEMYGKKRDRIGQAWRFVLEPLCYAVGKLKGGKDANSK